MSHHPQGKRQESDQRPLSWLKPRPGTCMAILVVFAGFLLGYVLLAPSGRVAADQTSHAHLVTGSTCMPTVPVASQDRDEPFIRNNTAGNPAQRLQSTNFSYLGAFRLPDEFNWGALGLSYHPSGSESGNLLVTGFQSLSSPDHPGEACWNPEWDCFAFYGQVRIPTPEINANWEALPQASLSGGMINFDQGLVAGLSRENSFVSDIEFFPRTGSQSRDKIYGAANFWYPEGDFGEGSFPTIWMTNMDGSGVQGMFHVGPDTTPFHGRKTGAYLFTAPQWYADQYLGGRRLITGRSRGTPATSEEPVTIQGGSQGPTFFAYQALDSDTPSGNLDALPMLYYRVKYPGCAGPNIGPTAECDYPGFTMCDDWTVCGQRSPADRVAFGPQRIGRQLLRQPGVRGSM